MFLLPVIGEARIIETAHIADAVPFIDEETWFLVDLDNTMFEGKQALGHTDWLYDERRKREQNGMTPEEAVQNSYPDWIRTQEICPVQPLE